jgi:hypothetical protein
MTEKREARVLNPKIKGQGRGAPLKRSINLLSPLSATDEDYQTTPYKRTSSFCIICLETAYYLFSSYNVVMDNSFIIKEHSTRKMTS